MAPPITWHGNDDAEDVDVDDALERGERDVLERADLGRGRVRRRVDRRGVDEHVRYAPVDLDQRERRLDRVAVGHVAACARAPTPSASAGREPLGGLGGAVEDRDAHARAPRARRESSVPSCPRPPVTTATRPERSNSGSVTAPIVLAGRRRIGLSVAGRRRIGL